MTEQEELKVRQLIALLGLYLNRENLEYGFPIGQLHADLREVYNIVHEEILNAVLPKNLREGNE